MATASEQALVEAVSAALHSGSRELERLTAIVTEAETRYRSAVVGLQPDGQNSSADGDAFVVLLGDIVDELKDRLHEIRRVASTFNIAFFGRTGAGKSTLLSALGRLGGELVSDGRSDFTTEVQPLDWHGCRLYDTPGINGWGRTRAQPDLEESAREAVEVADLVLLCFDSQSQQASEFRKVAEWVRVYRKPAIAVLNMRNTMWRHPAMVTDDAHRNGLAHTARQHADNIKGELDAIGLPGVPIVAINAKRSLFARAASPFVGPAASELEAERSRHGLEYLDRWSNLPVLERLISASVSEGAGDLRLAAWRDGIQAQLRVAAEQLDFVADQQQQRGVAIERKVATWLDVLGYPDATHDGIDLLRQLESIRGEPFTSPVSGRLEGHVRHLLRSHLYPHRTRSLRAAEDLVLEVFDTKGRLSRARFEHEVFDGQAVAKSIASVAEQANEFLSANLNLAGEDARIDLDLINRAIADVRGDAGWQRRGVANALRALGTLGTATSAVLAVVATTNFWNPAGWVAAVTLAGLGFGSWLLTSLGRWTRKGAEERRVAARSKAVADARAAVNAYFEECETSQLTRVMADTWARTSSPLRDLVGEALHTRMGCAALIAEAAWLREQAHIQPPAPSPTDVIQRATGRVLLQTEGWRPSNVEALLLGEDWISDRVHDLSSECLSEEDRQRFADAVEADREGFSAHLAEAFSAGGSESIRQWLEGAAASRLLDDEAREALLVSLALMDAVPKVLVLGDYSSGKSSLIKRMLAEVGAAGPTDLHVEAGPSTSEVRSYEFGRLVLLDSPGLQSGQDGHDGVALAALDDVALVIVVLHVNLLIGDTSHLRRVLLGDENTVGKAARTVFVIGRMDEIGADPRQAPGEFLARRQRKVDELLAILESLGFAVARSQVLALSADPYGLVGDRAQVTSSDYGSADRAWDGVSALCEPLVALACDRLDELAAAAALDHARSALLTARTRFSLQQAEIEQAQLFTQRLTQLLMTSRAELGLLEDSIEARTRRVVDDHANEVLSDALGAAPAEVDAMSKRLMTWWEDPRLASALDSLQGEFNRDVTDWWKRQSSQLDRELRRFEFAMDRDRISGSGRERGSAGGSGIHVAAGVMKGVHGIGKALGNRDAVYAIGKAMGAKFKPWGAVKLGAKVGKAAAVLGVVAVGFDIADFVRDQKQERGRERARKEAVEHVRTTADEVVSEILSDAEGPMEYVTQVDADLTGSLRQLREQAELQEQAAREIAERLDGVALLTGASEELARAKGEKVTT